MLAAITAATAMPTPLPPRTETLFNRLLARGRLRHLQLLVALADAGSVQRAAGLIGMSQPAATQALSDLEQLLDTPLYERHARGVRPTPSGQAILPALRSLLQALHSTTETLVLLQAGTQTRLRLGCIPAAASTLLRQAIPRLLESHTDLQVELIENSREHLVPMLAAGRLDAVLCRRPETLPTGWHFETLIQDMPVISAAPDHPLAGQSRVSLDALSLLPWVLPPTGMVIRDYFANLWAEHPHPPKPHPLSTTALPVALEVIRHSHAVMLSTHSTVATLLEWGQLVQLDIALPAPQNARGALGLLCTSATDSAARLSLRLRLRDAAQPG